MINLQISYLSDFVYFFDLGSFSPPYHQNRGEIKILLLSSPADSGLLSGGAAQPGRPDSGSGQRAAGWRERHPPGGAHLLQERDPAPAVGFPAFTVLIYFFIFEL